MFFFLHWKMKKINFLITSFCLKSVHFTSLSFQTTFTGLESAFGPFLPVGEKETTEKQKGRGIWEFLNRLIAMKEA